ncbi:hypothetical protein [Streptomyces monashensis]|uniref:Uncharacterized protein n=1 Tax=Streptomyces monashensis TaxID=1678012 RepID=A0A1S2QBH7_9ACTN|nr:hypothetical protein [Streptomyces monashensis]OIK03502.1 hypothetical protein BIV23_21675 [Streptomyces monashensis]
MNHGRLAGTLALVLLVLPKLAFPVALGDAARRAEGRLPPRAVPYRNALHRALVPLALIVACTVLPASWPPAFAAQCGRLALARIS